MAVQHNAYCHTLCQYSSSRSPIRNLSTALRIVPYAMSAQLIAKHDTQSQCHTWRIAIRYDDEWGLTDEGWRVKGHLRSPSSWPLPQPPPASHTPQVNSPAYAISVQADSTICYLSTGRQIAPYTISVSRQIALYAI
eukprot:2404266-Rhodomonas_salina.1